MIRLRMTFALAAKTAAILAAVAATGESTPLQAQNLRQGLAHARYVCTAKPLGLRPLGNELFVHHYEVVEALHGEPATRFSIVERKRVADTAKPNPRDSQPGTTVLLCLVDDLGVEVPERHRPVYRLTGFRGDHPRLDDSVESRGLRSLTTVLLSSRNGAAPADTAAALLDLAMQTDAPRTRVEAVRSLHERAVLRDHVSTIETEQILTAAVGETDALDVKIALAELAHDLRGAGALRPLCMALQQCGEARYAKTLGQLLLLEHGEDATEQLLPILGTARGEFRDRVLLTLGATRTRSALTELLRRRESADQTAAVDAALRLHGSAAARRALGERIR